MARPRQTRRKSVPVPRGLSPDIVTAIAEVGDIPDPEAYERERDEELLQTPDSSEEDPEEDPEEIPVVEIETEEDDDQIGDQDEQAPETIPAVEVPPASPATPPHVPLQGVPVYVHGWIVSRLLKDLAAAEARLAESRFQLEAERSARLRIQQVRMTPRPRAFRRRVARIERRALVRMRAVPTEGDGRVSRAAAERIVRIAMFRVRALTRARG